MTYKKLNEYIEHYLQNDKTNSAIMLTGAWGSGKSHYINHSMIPYLNEGSDNNRNCVVISLYGIGDLNEIARAIYFELRRINLLKSNEATQTGKIIVKAAFNAIPMLNIKGAINDKDLKKLYKSIDLTDKLIIFEDVERSHIDIIEFLGYVNNLTEQDNVKILLVANEEELLKQDMPIDLNEDQESAEQFRDRHDPDFVDVKEDSEYSETGKKYIITKEKTVRDTINFECDYQEAIKGIITSFDDDKPSSLGDMKKYIEEIATIVENNTGNLRSFIFACQKTSDIFSKGVEFDHEVRKCIFFSIIHFSLKLKKERKIVWTGGNDYSSTLGNIKYPLFKCCYEYIMNHHIKEEDLEKVNGQYQKFKRYNQNGETFGNFDTLVHFWQQRDQDVLNAMNIIKEQLKNNKMPLWTYGQLAFYFVKAGAILGEDISEFKMLLIKNLKNEANNVDKNTLFGIDKIEKRWPDGYKKLKDEMVDTINDNKVFYGNFDYKVSNIEKFSTTVLREKKRSVGNRELAYHIDIKKFSKMIKECHAYEISTLRRTFNSFYSDYSPENYSVRDADALRELLEKLIEIKNEWKGERIAEYNLSLFIEDIAKKVKTL